MDGKSIFGIFIFGMVTGLGAEGGIFYRSRSKIYKKLLLLAMGQLWSERLGLGLIRTREGQVEKVQAEASPYHIT